MARLLTLISKILGLFSKASSEQDLSDEVRSHLDMLAEENVRRGMSPEEARYSALRKFGGVEQTKETYREQRGLPPLESLFQDIRYAIRGLRRNPGFATVVIVTLALGIAASTAVFSVVDPLLFRSLPYPHDNQLVSLGYLGPVDNNEFNVVSSYLDWQQAQTPFQSITAMRPGVGCDALVGDVPRRIDCYAVDGNFLQTFGVAPVLGRDFSVEDNRPHSPGVALLSYGFWQSAFGADPTALGRTLIVDDEPEQIIGVLPKNFEMPQLGEIDVMTPAHLDPSLPRSVNSGSALRTFARLRPGVSIEQAHDRMLPLFNDSKAKDVPAVLLTEAHLVVRSLRDRQIHDVKLGSWMLLGSALALLLAACTNIANLMLARATVRRRELAMRAVLGAGRGRLVRQTLTESLLLGLLGGIAGCGAAWALLRICISLAPEGILRLDHARIDLRVLLFALAGSLGAALLFGMAPALDPPRAESLAGWHSVGSGRTLFRKALVAAQVAISLVLLTGASLLLRSLWKLQVQPLGYDTEHVVIASFSLRRHPGNATQTRANSCNELEGRMKQIPAGGIFAMSDSIPPRGFKGRPYSNLRIAGHPAVAQNGGLVGFRWVSPDYFKAMGIRILSGRGFEETERASGNSPIILSASLARRLFGNENPIGQQIDPDVSGHWCPVVGVAADIKNNGLTEPSDPEYYRLRMLDSPSYGYCGVAVFRTSLGPGILGRWVRKEFSEFDPTMPVDIQTLDQRVDQFRERPRFVATLVAIFAALGLALAAVGLYGVLSFLVARQTREIGVRMAIGAQPRDISRHIQKYAGTWTAIGVAIGLGGSFALARGIHGLLFEVSPVDPASVLIATSVLAVTAALAAWIPSRRAARVDPIVALRME